jgi:hypothetical protein
LAGGRGGIGSSGVESKRFFLKKKQKLFLIWTALVKPPLAQSKRSFLVLFFKKELLSFLT